MSISDFQNIDYHARVHIGRNDAIGSMFASKGVQCFSHFELSLVPWKSAKEITISAFDTKLKTELADEMGFEQQIVKMLSQQHRVIYFSTARTVLSGEAYASYVHNKRVAEEMFLSSPADTTVIRLANVLDVCQNFVSRFQRSLRSGIENRQLQFGCRSDNSWNFVTNKNLCNTVDKYLSNSAEFRNNILYGYSRAWLSAEEIACYLMKKFDIKSVVYGHLFLPYPTIEDKKILNINCQKSAVLEQLGS